MAPHNLADVIHFGNGDNGAQYLNPMTTMANSAHGSDALSLWKRHDELKLAGVKRTVLLEEVITRYENLSLKHAELVREHDSQRTYMATAKSREKELADSVKRLQFILNRDPFVLVLIDGDGMVFEESLLCDGEKGGRQAAGILRNEVKKWFAQAIPDGPSEYKIVTRIYANIKGLGDACVRAGLIDSVAKFEDFTRGLTRGSSLFDWVDVGSGKDRADVKIIDNLKLHLFDFHCHQILFGCSHDNGFARTLETYMDDSEVLDRITLLEGVPFEKELAELPFKTTKFAGLFRDQKVNLAPSDLFTGQGPRQPSLVTATSGFLTPRVDTPTSFTDGYTTVGNKSRPGSVPSLITTCRAESDASSSVVSPTGSYEYLMMQDTWASRAKSAAKLPPPAPAPRPVHGPSEAVRHNRKGQRIDSVVNYDTDMFKRVKKIKMCNQHYLGGNGCNKSQKCPHRHDYRPNDAELMVLKGIARETPCKKGTGCEEADCIYGHRCPFPMATQGSSRGIGCLMSESCRFPHEMHGITDLAPVKMTKVTGM